MLLLPSGVMPLCVSRKISGHLANRNGPTAIYHEWISITAYDVLQLIIDLIDYRLTDQHFTTLYQNYAFVPIGITISIVRTHKIHILQSLQ